MAIDVATVAAGFALLAPVYVQLFQIHREVGALSADHENTADRLNHIEGRLQPSGYP